MHATCDGIIVNEKQPDAGEKCMGFEKSRTPPGSEARKHPWPAHSLERAVVGGPTPARTNPRLR